MYDNDQIPKHRSSKDTRRWCKGVVGRKHVTKWVENRDYIEMHEGRVYSQLVCVNCRKVFDRLFPWGGTYGPGF